MSAVLRGPVTEARAFVRQADVVPADETGCGPGAVVPRGGTMVCIAAQGQNPKRAPMREPARFEVCAVCWMDFLIGFSLHPSMR